MKPHSAFVPAFLGSIVLAVTMGASAPPAFFGQEDIEGAKDHPLLSRMNDFIIDEYEESEFDSEEFYDEQDNEYVIEGHKWVIGYQLKDEAASPGVANIRLNFQNALKKIGATVIRAKDTWKLARDGKEIWINLWIEGNGVAYRLRIVEKAAHEQEVKTDPEAWRNDIRATGHAAVYGIYFDTDSAVLKPESEAAVKAIAGLLKADGALKLYIVGHTDMVGKLDYNMDLSARRAQAVVDALVGKNGIAAERLAARGAGPLCPVATNANEDGRKLNRRVELVAR